ncbi:MAG: biotin--[acetyl-CoA-carboxylase] ligase, partial [Candidatus Margulisbacteria bacterium]|nr:biotin--[acetyl-CoA-carboxylase] ligase [Candidatus Margulisiibacteriota bacterium]
MIGKNRFHFVDIASTQDKARELAQNNCGEGAVVIAERQSEGRGKPGSSWFSPDGGVYLSVVLKPYKSPA